MSGFRFALLQQDGAARRGRIETAHGAIETPAFMRGRPAKAATSMNRVERGRWKLVSSRSTARKR